MDAARFRINEPEVSHEEFEDETLVINLTSGSYYSLRGTARAIWPALAQGNSVVEVVEAWRQRFPAVAAVDGAIQTFADKLVAEQLIVPVTESVAVPPVPTVAASETFVPPEIESYSDMRDLLLIDPIHEVDVTGWPARPPEPEAE